MFRQAQAQHEFQMWRHREKWKTLSLPLRSSWRQWADHSHRLVINTAKLGTVPADGTEVLRLRGRVGTHIYWVPIMYQGLH